MSALTLKKFNAHNIEWIIHTGIWAFIISERFINHFTEGEHAVAYGIHQIFFLVVTFILPIYINAFALIPRYLNRKKWLTYIILLIALILSMNLIRGLSVVLLFRILDFDFSPMEEFLKWSLRDYASFDKFIFSSTSWIIWASLAYRLIKDWVENEGIKEKLKNEKAMIELAFLRTQVNPHFLFNTLNNIYALALHEKAELTADSVSRMGALMRYSLHDSQADRILLENEVDYIEKYIDLQKLRITENSNIIIESGINLKDIHSERIAPMILIPFIENAFKYGISRIEPSLISIELSIENGILFLFVKNTVHSGQPKSQGGIGLKNALERLRLIYPGKHDLRNEEESSFYIVNLKIDLNS
jgi:two-component system, LytTR family, sensor kinase